MRWWRTNNEYLKSSKNNTYSSNSIQSGVEESNQSIFARTSVISECLKMNINKKTMKKTYSCNYNLSSIGIYSRINGTIGAWAIGCVCPSTASKLVNWVNTYNLFTHTDLKVISVNIRKTSPCGFQSLRNLSSKAISSSSNSKFTNNKDKEEKEVLLKY